jgi:hypothetical protein
MERGRRAERERESELKKILFFSYTTTAVHRGLTHDLMIS